MKKPIEISGAKARSGSISGRMILVLGVSLVLALVAMILLLSYVYTQYSPWVTS